MRTSVAQLVSSQVNDATTMEASGAKTGSRQLPPPPATYPQLFSARMPSVLWRLIFDFIE